MEIVLPPWITQSLSEIKFNWILLLHIIMAKSENIHTSQIVINLS